MKELSGTATADVAAALAEAYAVLVDVERYRDWYPDVIHRVEVLERHPNGDVVLADASLSAPGIPLIGELDLRLRVDTDPERTVTLTRVPYDPDDRDQFVVAWTLSPLEAGTRLSVELAAVLPLPRLVPTNGLGDRVAGGFVRAAARALEAPPP